MSGSRKNRFRLRENEAAQNTQSYARKTKRSLERRDETMGDARKNPQNPARKTKRELEKRDEKMGAVDKKRVF